MDKETVTLYVGLLAAFVTAAGWVITNYLAKKKEEDFRRQEAKKRRLERQIEEFYGPLYNLIHQIVICNHIQHDILTGNPRKDSTQSPSDEDKVRQFFQDKYFVPLHNEMIGILKTKLYLIDGARIPESIREYLHSSIQEQAQGLLWREHGVATDYVKGVAYPNSIYRDVKTGLLNAMRNYELYISDAKTTPSVSAEPRDVIPAVHK